MEELIEALIIEIKKDNRYVSFFTNEKRLQDDSVQNLLNNYQEALNTYQDLKKYNQYIDISQQADDLKQLKKQISENNIIQDYYQSYHALNDLLDSVTKIVYNNISEELDLSQYKL